MELTIIKAGRINYTVWNNDKRYRFPMKIRRRELELESGCVFDKGMKFILDDPWEICYENRSINGRKQFPRYCITTDFDIYWQEL